MISKRQLLKELQANGYSHVRTNKHIIYSNGTITLHIPNHDKVSIGILRQLSYKTKINFVKS